MFYVLFDVCVADASIGSIVYPVDVTVAILCCHFAWYTLFAAIGPVQYELLVFTLVTREDAQAGAVLGRQRRVIKSQALVDVSSGCVGGGVGDGDDGGGGRLGGADGGAGGGETG